MLLQLRTGDCHVSLAALLPQILVWALLWASLLGKWAVAHQEVLTHLLHFSKVPECSFPRRSATVLKHKKLHNMSSYGTEMLPERPISPTAAKVKAEVHVQWSLLETRAQESGFSPAVEEQMGGKLAAHTPGGDGRGDPNTFVSFPFQRFCFTVMSSSGTDTVCLLGFLMVQMDAALFVWKGGCYLRSVSRSDWDL